MSVIDVTYARVHELVVSGELGPGTRLAELPLAARLGVSRPTLREALRRLESQELAVSDGRGLRVAALDRDGVRSVLLMRSSLEGLHAELVATRVGQGEIAPAALRRLAGLADDAERSTDAGDYRRAVQGNRAFHQAIDRLADSPVSAAALDGLWDRLVLVTERSLIPAARATAVNREHRDLLAAVLTANAPRAAAIAVAHTRATLTAWEMNRTQAAGQSLTSTTPSPVGH
jgi:DNA-binding GntR family transcriptional regulator